MYLDGSAKCPWNILTWLGLQLVLQDVYHERQQVRWTHVVCEEVLAELVHILVSAFNLNHPEHMEILFDTLRRFQNDLYCVEWDVKP